MGIDFGRAARSKLHSRAYDDQVFFGVIKTPVHSLCRLACLWGVGYRFKEL
jgi:hypothetical protein